MSVPAKKRFDTRDIAYTAMGVALIAVCAWIRIPLPQIPVTLQTFAVFTVLGTLGGLRGTVAVAVYLALGAVGAPVFSGFAGGWQALVGATGGYLTGFLLSALIYWGITALFGKSALARIAGMAAGLLVCYAAGTAWFVAFCSRTANPVGVGGALMACVVPFILPDAVKLAFAFTVSRALGSVIAGK